MTDIMSPAKRSRLMSRIKGKNTTPERYIGALLQASGVKFEQHENMLPGRPDFVFPNKRVAVFIDGDFWHGWRFPRWRHRVGRFWQAKIAGNRKRDEKNCRKLARRGWRVVRIWEHQVEKDAITCIRHITRVLGVEKINWKRIDARFKALPPLRRRNRLPKP